jgi:Uncharacterized conserved protein
MNYTLKIDDFEGPLDLLLHLVKESKMDIFNIKIEIIIDQYLDYIHSMDSLNLNIASEYLVMASEMVELKSKMLLPRYEEETSEEIEEDPKEVLINKLIEYQKYKDKTLELRKLQEERSEIFTRLPSDLKEYNDGETVINNSNITLEDLVKAFESFLERQEQNKPLNTKVTNKEISVEERRISIKNILRIKRKVNFFELFEIVTKEYVVVTFLAILEMARKNEIRITQTNSFDEIICEVQGE